MKSLSALSSRYRNPEALLFLRAILKEIFFLVTSETEEIF
jgi:hypothetical protein